MAYPLVAASRNLCPRDHSGAFYQEPNLAIFGCLVAAGRNPFPWGPVEQFTTRPKLIFIAFFPINFNSTALFKDAFLGLDLAGEAIWC